MSRRRRRQEAHDLVRRFRELPPEQAGLIMSVLLGNALISVALQVVLLATYARAARRAFRVRRDGTRTMAHAALTRPVVTLTVACSTHLVCTQLLQPRWVRQAVRRAETCAAARGPAGLARCSLLSATMSRWVIHLSGSRSTTTR